MLLKSPGNDETQQLQKALLDYLEENAETDPSLVVRLLKCRSADISEENIHVLNNMVAFSSFN